VTHEALMKKKGKGEEKGEKRRGQDLLSLNSL